MATVANVPRRSPALTAGRLEVVGADFKQLELPQRSPDLTAGKTRTVPGWS